ncbi:MAG: DUF1232 domain-containing protein [Bacillaceae bacterium]|nr:DUF1232 domain-containing protein [Bacillaceae bacterium]
MVENKLLKNWKTRVNQLKSKIHILYLAYRDPRTPVYAKLFAFLVVAYALSPVDLIPDFIPVLGILDDLILLPIGILLAFRMIPLDILQDLTQKNGPKAALPKSGRIVALVIILITWFLVIILIFTWLYRTLSLTF